MSKLKFIQNMTISHKIVVIILSVSSLVIGIGFTFAAIWNINNLKADIQASLLVNAKLVGSYCVVPLIFKDYKQASEALLSLSNIENIEVAYLFDDSGSFFASYQEILPNNPKPKINKQQNNVFQDGYFYIQENIIYKEKFYGTLFIKKNSNQLNSSIRNTIVTFSLLGLVLIFISYILAHRMQRYISKPILKLKSHFDSIAKSNDFTAHIARQNNDEIGSLYDGFNNLLIQISTKQEERDKAQSSQKESDTQLKLIADNFVNGMIYQVAMLDENKRQFNYISETVNKLYGCTVTEAKNNSGLIYGKLHPDDVNSLFEKEKEALEKMSIFKTEARVINNDGTIRWAYFISKPRIIKGIVCWDGIEIDITERVKAEENLNASRKKLNLALQGGEIGVWEWDLSTDVTIWDAKMENMFGLEEGEFNQTYEAFKDCIHPDDLSYTEDAIEKAFNNIAPYDIVYRVIWKNKEVKFIRAKALIIKDKEENPVSMIGICIDVTKTKSAELEIKTLNENLEQRINDRTKQLETANKELESFSYSISHDLRTPLRAIVGFTEKLNNEYAEKFDEEGKRLASVIIRNTNKMGTLIDELLNFSRLGRKKINLKPIDMQVLFKRNWEELKPENNGRRINVEIYEMPKAEGDEVLINQVVINLLSNAIKFTKYNPKANIEIGTIPDEKKNIYYIKDNGVGFNMKYSDKLFQVFQRLHSEREFEGTGIGLAIVNRIISKHGGEVWAEGFENKGATIYFSLQK